MNYQLPNGRTINISVEAYLKMTDDDINRLNEKHIGSCSSDPYDLSLDAIETPEEDPDVDLEIE